MKPVALIALRIFIRALSAFGLMASCYGQDASYVGAPAPETRKEVYGQGVRETNWLSPEEERAGFRLPPGFAIHLFASEPEIAKPLNMAWDQKGRLWISNTVEYPYPVAETAPAKDSIKILEDTDGDGRADSVKTFADGLNIPMGLLPVVDGVICFSIPYIWHLRDTNGDDKVDDRIQLLGPFDTSRDTHGMINSLRRGSDGWIYACHGFNNQSSVAARDGSTVELISGNTFRFKEDGSTIQLVSQGQVNPFGMTHDEWGNWYTADCHSKPLTAVLRGGCYPSFGRPDDGLGFAPEMMQHLHGSTAISGLLYYLGDAFPPAYRRIMFSGNVMTSRINCNRLVWNGATPTAQELPDFLTSNDPWFRPVDIQLGPDGAVYVADFYNKIIGHYEVPLTHPGRDRLSGRIWRISYQDASTPTRLPVLSRNATAWNPKMLTELSEQTGNPTQIRAMIEQIVALENLPQSFLSDIQSQSLPNMQALLIGLEILFRRGELNERIVQETLAKLRSRSNASSLEWTRYLTMSMGWPEAWQQLALSPVREFISDPNSDAHVRRSSSEYLGALGDESDVSRLVTMIGDVAAYDPSLAHTAKIAVRDIIRRIKGDFDPALLEILYLADSEIELRHADILAEILPGVGTPESAELLMNYINRTEHVSPKLMTVGLEYAARVGPDSTLPLILRVIERLTERDLSQRAARFDLLVRAVKSQQTALPMEMKQFGSVLVDDLIDAILLDPASMKSSEWVDGIGESWGTEPRKRADQSNSDLLSSFTRGEQYTGVLRSEAFVCPSEMRFFLAGHNGHPSQPDHHKNLVRLISERTGLPWFTAYPPRSDIATEIVWSTAGLREQRVRMELVDGSNDSAYAWLAAGDFSVESLNHHSASNLARALSTVLATGVWVDHPAGQLYESDFASLDRLKGLSPRTRVRLRADLARGKGDVLLEALLRQSIDLDRVDLVPDQFRSDPENRQHETAKLATELCASATGEKQSQLAAALASSAEGCELIASLLQQGKLSQRSVAGLDTLLPRTISPATRTIIESAMKSAAGLPQSSVVSAQRLQNLDWSTASRNLGKSTYDKHCAVCHQLGGSGQLIGPQLDGVLTRGALRLSEDILEPNRNVDLAFRQTTVLLDTDEIVSGLVHDQADGRITLTKQNGQVEIFPPERIRDRKQSDKSLMPANFDELMTDYEFASLLKYLTEFTPVH